MELEKTQKFDLKEIRVSPARSPLNTRVLNLEVGEGFIVRDMEHSHIANVYAIAKDANKKIALHKIGKHDFQIVRVK